MRNAFANFTSTNKNLRKTQMSKIIQSGGFIGKKLALPDIAATRYYREIR